ncbi:hypothetical protein OK016_00415 [Vibrio chagasii]|nr:hypothetical protein [Vibrio chagasii]
MGGRWRAQNVGRRPCHGRFDPDAPEIENASATFAPSLKGENLTRDGKCG